MAPYDGHNPRLRLYSGVKIRPPYRGVNKRRAGPPPGVCCYEQTSDPAASIIVLKEGTCHLNESARHHATLKPVASRLPKATLARGMWRFNSWTGLPRSSRVSRARTSSNGRSTTLKSTVLRQA